MRNPFARISITGFARIWMCAALIVLGARAYSAFAAPAAKPATWPAWIDKQKIRATYDYAHVDKREHFAKLAAHGINTILLSWSGDVDQPESIEQLKTQAKWCAQLGLHLFPTITLCAGKLQLRYLQPGGRCFVSADGTPLTKTPCPADSDFWGNIITRRAKLIATLSLRYPAISGFVIDDEMYGADSSNYQGHCYCSACFQTFLKHLSLEPPALKPAERFAWLQEQKLMEKYQAWQSGAVESQSRSTEVALHSIAPGFVIGGFHLDQLSWPRDAWARGLGTPEMPVVALPESTYPSGATPYLLTIPNRLAEVGAHAVFCPGLWFKQFPVENVAGHLFYMAQGPAGKYGPQESVGYWVFTTYGLALPEMPQNTDYALPLPHEPWWEAIRTANKELDRQAREGKSFVPRLKLVHRQDSPRVALEKIGLWRPAKVTLQKLFPTGQAARPSGEPARLRYQSVYYLFVNTGDVIRAQLQSTRCGDGQQRPVFALTAPGGNVVTQGDIEPGQAVPLVVTATERGLYKLALSIEQHATSVAIDMPHSVLSVLDGVSMLQHTTRMYFYVPPAVERFVLEVGTPYAAEQARLVVWDPDGAEIANVQTKELIAARAVVSTPPAQRGRVWSFQAMPADHGVFYSANLTWDPQLPPFLAESPEALLIPAD